MTTATAPVTATATAIHTRALLVWLSISTWSARKYDRAVSEQVNRQHAASSNAGRYNKFLLPGQSDAYNALVTLAGTIRTEHYSKTLAWSDEGWRVLPTADYMPYMAWYRQRKSEFLNAFDTFVAEYPAAREQAKALLNGLYKDSDYPDVQDMRKRFAVSVNVQPMPIASDIRCDLGQDQIDEISASVTEQVNSALGKATADAWQRLYTVVQRISERLSDADAIFRDSLIENARELCAALKSLNVAGDPNLESMRAAVEASLTVYEPDTLRENKRKRADVAAKADDILSQMSAYFTPAQ